MLETAVPFWGVSGLRVPLCTLYISFLFFFSRSLTLKLTSLGPGPSESRIHLLFD